MLAAHRGSRTCLGASAYVQIPGMTSVIYRAVTFPLASRRWRGICVCSSERREPALQCRRLAGSTRPSAVVTAGGQPAISTAAAAVGDPTKAGRRIGGGGLVDESRWSAGAGAVLPAGATFTVPLTLSDEVWFSARVVLLPHDWRDGRGVLRLRRCHGTEWPPARSLVGSAPLIGPAGSPRGQQLACRFPAPRACISSCFRASTRTGPSRARSGSSPRSPTPAAYPLRPHPDPATPASAPSATSAKPLISVLTPVHDPPPAMLEEAIASVRAQTFGDWELCLVDDGSTDPEIIAALERHAASDPRIHARAPRARGRDLRRHQRRARARHRRIHRPARPRRHARPRRPATRRRPDRRPPDLDMIYSDEDIVSTAVRSGRISSPAGHPTRCAPTATPVISASTGERWSRDRRVSHRVRRLPGRRHDPAADRAHRPDRPHPPDPLPLARPCRLHRGRRRQAVRVRGGAQCDRRPPGAQRHRRGGRIRAAGPLPGGASGRSVGASRSCWPSTTSTGSRKPPDPGSRSPTPRGPSSSPPRSTRWPHAPAPCGPPAWPTLA